MHQLRIWGLSRVLPAVGLAIPNHRYPVQSAGRLTTRQPDSNRVIPAKPEAFSTSVFMLARRVVGMGSMLAILLSLSDRVAAEEVSHSQACSAIRCIDFGNFTYSNLGLDDRTITLKKGNAKRPRGGESSLEEIEYVDLDGDGSEEAAITIATEVANSHAEDYVVFTYRNAHPKVIFHYFVDDGSGVPGSSAPDGMWIIGSRLIVRRGIYAADDALCCPTFRESLVYEMRDGRLQFTTRSRAESGERREKSDDVERQWCRLLNETYRQVKSARNAADKLAIVSGLQRKLDTFYAQHDDEVDTDFGIRMSDLAGYLGAFPASDSFEKEKCPTYRGRVLDLAGGGYGSGAVRVDYSQLSSEAAYALTLVREICN